MKGKLLIFYVKKWVKNLVKIDNLILMVRLLWLSYDYDLWWHNDTGSRPDEVVKWQHLQLFPIGRSQHNNLTLTKLTKLN